MTLARRVFVISELYYPEETSTGHFLTRIAEGIAAQFDVRVLCSQPTYASQGRNAATDELLNRVNIHRCWSTTFRKDILLLRIVNITTIVLSILINGLRRFRAGDCVIVVTNPPILPFTVLLASRLRKSKCCLIIHDVYPEVLVATGLAKQSSFAVQFIGLLTQKLYRQMSRIVVLGRDMDSLMRRKLTYGRHKITTIPNWGDLDLIRPSIRRQNTLLTELGLTEKFVIQYSGNIGRTHGIEDLACCAENLLKESKVHFLFIGFGGKKAWLEDQIRKRDLSNVTIIDYRPRSELPVSLNACDVAIISFVKGMAGISVPSRMYNVMAAGKPIITVADPDSELALVIEEEGIGWVIPSGDIDGLRMAILEAKANPDLLVQMGRRARQAAETKYAYERVQKAYTELITSLYEEAR